MWKWIPFFIIVIAAGVGGILLAADLKRRRKELEQFLLGLRVMETEMQYSASALWLCFQRSGEALKTEIRRVFLHTAEYLKISGNGESSFLNALEESRDDLALTDGDLEKIRHFAFGLGTADMDQTLKGLRQTREQVELSLSEAERNEKKWGRVLQNGGWLTGLAVALIFI